MNATVVRRLSTHAVRVADNHGTEYSAMLHEQVLRLFPEERLKELLQPGRIVYVQRCSPTTLNSPLNDTEPIRVDHIVTHIDEL